MFMSKISPTNYISVLCLMLSCGPPGVDQNMNNVMKYIYGTFLYKSWTASFAEKKCSLEKVK